MCYFKKRFFYLDVEFFKCSKLFGPCGIQHFELGDKYKSKIPMGCWIWFG